MLGSLLNLWNPVHVAGAAIIITALLLGMIHGITPDEHTWPITFSYAIGSYSTRRGLWAGLVFSTAFTLQRAIASELAYLGFAHALTYGVTDYLIYIVVGAVMVWAGLLIMRRSHMPFHFHLRLWGLQAEHHNAMNPAHSEVPTWVNDPRPWMPAVHGFIAGWGFGAFAIIIYTVLAPAMPAAVWGWVPGAMFGIGTSIIQVLAGAAFGKIAARQGLTPAAIRHVALTVASRTLTWGGCAFVLGGIAELLFPTIANVGVTTGIQIHNLHHLGIPIFLAMFSVMGVGMTTLILETRTWSQRLRNQMPMNSLKEF